MSGDLTTRVKKRALERTPEPGTADLRRSAPTTTGSAPVSGHLTGGVGALLESTGVERARPADPLGGQVIPDDVSTGLRRRRGGGDALPTGIADVAGQHLGRDLSGVRLHTDPGAGALARSVQAQAFTQGNDIYFSQGSFNPGTTAGRHLLAHELAHVAQGPVGAGPVVGRADDPQEAAADRVADRIAPALQHLTPTPGTPAPARPSGETSGADGLQRKISKTGRDIDAVRSTKGQKKGARTNDTLHRIGKLVDQHARLDDEDKIFASLGLIVGLCRHWLDKHKKSSKPNVTALVEDILAEAHRDHGVARAQRRYVNAARAGSGEAKPTAGTNGGSIPRKGMQALPYQNTPHALMMGIGDSAVKKSEDLSKGRPDLMKVHPENWQTDRAYVIRMAGLTEAEILAITKFSSTDFNYINPAMESQVRHQVDGKTETGGWLRSQMGSVQKGLNTNDHSNGRAKRGVGYDQLVEEGTLHAGVAMQGLAKLKAMKGTVYRGERMSPATFKKMYGGSPTTTFTSFKSMTTMETKAKDFSTDGVGGNTVTADQTISVLCIFEVDDARDIRPFSEIRDEHEWLVLPGSTFDVTSIKDEVTGAQPSLATITPITEWKIVRLKQRSKPAPGPSPAPLKKI